LARAKREELDYFPLDVNEDIDDEIELVEAEHGFDWRKEVIQICVSKKNKFIFPWIEKVLQN
jgi:hypothetical protein